MSEYDNKQDSKKDYEKEQYTFFAMMSRMKFINRWGLMRNTFKENDSEHSLEVAMIAHALATIHNLYYGGNIHAERVALYAMYHDVTEIITGDLPTPVKYDAPEIKAAYRTVEEKAIVQLLERLPLEMKPLYETLLDETKQEAEYRKYVKAADKISALIKCLEEKNMGNMDFLKAEQSIRQTIASMDMPEVEFFMNHFLNAYSLTLDEQ